MKSASKNRLMDNNQLAEIEARAKAATEGPWWTYANPMRDDGVFIGAGKREETWPKEYLSPQMRVKAERGIGLAQVSHADGAFIAGARQDIPDLIAYIRKLEGQRDWLLGEVEAAEEEHEWQMAKKAKHG